MGTRANLININMMTDCSVFFLQIDGLVIYGGFKRKIRGKLKVEVYC